MKTQTMKTQTIGQEASKLANEYLALYKNLKQNHPELNVEALALHDLVCKKLVYEFAIEELKQKIKEAN